MENLKLIIVTAAATIAGLLVSLSAPTADTADTVDTDSYIFRSWIVYCNSIGVDSDSARENSEIVDDFNDTWRGSAIEENALSDLN